MQLKKKCLEYAWLCDTWIDPFFPVFKKLGIKCLSFSSDMLSLTILVMEEEYSKLENVKLHLHAIKKVISPKKRPKNVILKRSKHFWHTVTNHLLSNVTKFKSRFFQLWMSRRAKCQLLQSFFLSAKTFWGQFSLLLLHVVSNMAFHKMSIYVSSIRVGLKL